MTKQEVIKKIKQLCSGNSDYFISDIISTIDWWGMIILQKPELNLESISPREVNVITHYCFRNTHLEAIHGESVPFDDKAMKRLMLEPCGKMCEWIKFRDAL